MIVHKESIHGQVFSPREVNATTHETAQILLPCNLPRLLSFSDRNSFSLLCW